MILYYKLFIERLKWRKFPNILVWFRVNGYSVRSMVRDCVIGL